MLKATVLSAVQSIRSALGDLLVDATLVARVYSAHVPGTAPTHGDTNTAVSVCVSKYREKEIDRERILASDYQAIILPVSPDLVLSADVNDQLTVPALSKTFRIVTAQKILAGDSVAAVVAQIRI